MVKHDNYVMDYYYLIFLPVAVGLGGLMTIVLNERWHQLHDRLHLALLLCSTAMAYITLRALVVGTNDYAYIVLDNIETLVGLLLFPLFFLYIRCITHDTKWHGWYWWLFAPGVILCVAGTVLSILVGWNRILELRGNAYQAFVPNPESLVEKLYLLINIQVFNLTLEGMAVVLVALSIYHLAMYHKLAGNYYANLEDSSISNMNYFLFFGIILFAAIFVITYRIRVVITQSEGILLGISLCLSVILYTIIYNAFKIRMTRQQEEAIEEQPSPISGMVQNGEADNNILARRITEWEEQKDKPFCKEGITLAELAKEFGVSRRILSEYINEQKGMNFNAWVNALRVEEAKRLLRTSREMKVGYIADVCGFGTQSAFCKTFRQIVGMTPQSYREKNK